MDYGSLAMSDVHPCDLWRHQFDDRGQTVAISYDAQQKWYYLDAHTVDEVTMIKIWDNDANVQGKCESLRPNESLPTWLGLDGCSLPTSEADRRLM